MTTQIGTLEKGSNDREWHLLNGSGARISDYTIAFPTPFAKVPQVSVSLSRLDVDHTKNLRIRLVAKDIFKTNFSVEFETWADSRIYSATVSWVATDDY